MPVAHSYCGNPNASQAVRTYATPVVGAWTADGRFVVAPRSPRRCRVPTDCDVPPDPPTPRALCRELLYVAACGLMGALGGFVVGVVVHCA